MPTRKIRQRRRSGRRGASAVELAFISIPLFIVIFAAIELGRGAMAVPKYFAGRSYTASCVLPREAEPEL